IEEKPSLYRPDPPGPTLSPIEETLQLTLAVPSPRGDGKGHSESARLSSLAAKRLNVSCRVSSANYRGANSKLVQPRPGQIEDTRHRQLRGVVLWAPGRSIDWLALPRFESAACFCGSA